MGFREVMLLINVLQQVGRTGRSCILLSLTPEFLLSQCPLSNRQAGHVPMALVLTALELQAIGHGGPMKEKSGEKPQAPMWECVLELPLCAVWGPHEPGLSSRASMALALYRSPPELLNKRLREDGIISSLMPGQ